jgi:hypothetical protein
VALFEVGRLEEIKVDESDLQSETTRTLDTIQRIYQPKEVRKMVTGNFVQNMVSSIAADMLTARTLERLRAYAKGELSTEPVQAEPEAPEKASKPKRKKKAAEETPVKAAEASEIVMEQKTTPAASEAPVKPKRKKKTEEKPAND